jgi:prepilin signal peptidase PulO-like enzyme (type II secretory pathway)
VIVIADIRCYRIPDYASLPLIGGGIVCATFDGTAPSGIVGAVVGYVFMIAVEFLYRHLRGRSGLGRGDAKLFAAAGAWVGWAGLPLVLLIAAGSGLVVAVAIGRRDSPIPFAPFLALGILTTFAAHRYGYF